MGVGMCGASAACLTSLSYGFEPELLLRHAAADGEQAPGQQAQARMMPPIPVAAEHPDWRQVLQGPHHLRLGHHERTPLQLHPRPANSPSHQP